VDEMKFVEEICIDCAIRYWVPVEFQDQRLRDHNIFHCPNGHEQLYTDPSSGLDREERYLENKCLKKRVMQMRHELDQKDAALSENRQELDEFTAAKTNGMVKHRPRNARPWQCSVCGKSYKSESYARRHAKREHAPQRGASGRGVTAV